MVVIQDAVIYTFAGGTFLINRFILLAPPWNPGRKSQIPINLKINRASIAALGTFRGAGALGDFATGQGTAVFPGLLVFVEAPSAHLKAGPAEGTPVLVQGDILWKAVHGAIPEINVNQCVDAPMFKQPVGGHVVMGGIKAEIGR